MKDKGFAELLMFISIIINVFVLILRWNETWIQTQPKMLKNFMATEGIDLVIA